MEWRHIHRKPLHKLNTFTLLDHFWSDFQMVKFLEKTGQLIILAVVSLYWTIQTSPKQKLQVVMLTPKILLLVFCYKANFIFTVFYPGKLKKCGPWLRLLAVLIDACTTSRSLTLHLSNDRCIRKFQKINVHLKWMISVCSEMNIFRIFNKIKCKHCFSVCKI